VALEPGRDEIGREQSHLPEADSDWLVLGLVDEAPGGILDAAPDGILSVDDANRILSVNRKVETLFGYPRAELVGRPVHLLLPLWPSTRSPLSDGPSAWSRSTNQAARAIGRRQDGSGVPVEVVIRALHTEGARRAVAVVRAVDTADAAAGVSANDIIERTHDGIWVVDAASLRVIYANHGLAQRLGYRHDDVVGMGIDLIAPGFVDDELRHPLTRLRDDPGSSLVHRLELRGADGSRIPVEVRTQALPAAGGAESGTHSDAYMSFARDLSERAEKQSARRTTQVAAEVLDDRARIGRDLHDGVLQRIFATAMAVRALGPKTAGTGVGSDLARIVEELDGCIHDLRSAVDGIAPEGDVKLGLRADLWEILADERAALMLTPNVQFGGEFDEIDGELRRQILAIFREVLSNVARHAHASQVDIVVEATDGSFLLRVGDDGVGFDPSGPWSGRGLRNLTQRARLLGGTFTIRSNYGEGTVVECRVPHDGPDR
jgi:PAS domain S-box-containing protein